jgi:type I restriction-modification system DNA methylase subunit
MFKEGTIAGLTSAQSIVQHTQNDVNKKDTTYHKEKNNTTLSARKLNGAHHGVRPQVEIYFFHLLLLFFYFYYVALK